MAYDEDLAGRLRDHLEGEAGLTEQRMFGGLAFLVGGHLAVAASGQGGLLLRCAADDTDRLCQEPHVAPFQMGGRTMRGWLAVDAAAAEGDADLARWADIGVAYVRTLPPK